MKSPQTVQLSRFKTPKRGKGRPYTVDFGVAKPLPIQLLSYLANRATFGWNLTRSNNRLRMLGAVFAFYIAMLLPLFTPQRIVYADPIIPPYAQPIAKLVMPTVAHVEALERILTPLAVDLANTYAWGNCTAYVASRLPVPSDWGNAITWGTIAQSQGYEVSDTPKVGSIAWNVTDSYLGHVALVEAVEGDVVTISEMNYQGLGVVDTRVASPGEFRYIYL